MKRLKSILFILLSLSSISRGEEPPFFPLMAWNWAPSDDQVFRKMKECGLTVAGFVSPKELDRCQAAGLKAIVSDPRTSDYDFRHVDETAARARVSSLVAEVGKHPALYGFYLRDEPGADLFPGLATVSGLIRELAPGKWPYINLFPNYANAQQLGTATYEEHLQKFIETCKPTALSYDHYALMDDGSLRHGYWQNLESMRKAAQKQGVPFWNIVLSVAHFNYREPTAADLRFQVYSTLACGGRGIAYFTYFAPAVGNYRGAPIDQFGNPTPAWSWLQNVNLQVQKLAPTLLQLKPGDAYHFGTPPSGCAGPNEKSLLKPGNAPDFMAGEFTDPEGARYVMVMNKDVVKSRHCDPQFQVPIKKLRMVSPYSGGLIDFSGEQKWLAPGQGVLLKVDL